MEECCVVCAEPLEWVGYGICGHRDVCSTCITRLRFVLNDRRCCICKQECPSVYITKALGDFTNLVSDFDSLSERRDLWYEANTQAYFDDEEHYRMIKAMCRLSCSICEQAEDAGKDFVKKGFVFRNLDLLRRHLLHAHRVQMCGLCLEGRKVFISEQKLYSRVQLDRHASKGDPEVDGNSEERGGFTGHPICDFCRRRFYGDNELYQHMSMDHYTCHICQRLRPGRYDYYRNYDDLEAHFRYEHALCEHPECLAKKFVVFASDAELKRHNALSHGGNMSRAERNAALQIPVSFQYRRSGQERGGDGPFRRRGNHSIGQSTVGAQAHPGSNNTEHVNDSTASAIDTNGPSLFDNSEGNVPESSAVENVGIESASSSSGNGPARYLAAVSGTGPSSLADSAFPPLPGSKNARRKTKQRTRGSVVSMAALLGGGRQRSLVTEQVESGNFERESLRSQTAETVVSNVSSQAVARQNPSEDIESVRESSSAVDHRNFSRTTNESVNEVIPHAGLGETGNDLVQLSTEELRIANKALVDSIRSDLKGDEEHFNDFKDISAQFRRGEIDAKVYLKHITSFGLSNRVPELARLCPDPEKQRNLLEAYKEHPNSKQLNSSRTALPALVERLTSESISENGKDPVMTETPDEASMQSTVGTTASLRLTDRGGPNDDTDVEVLSKDGYRDVKGKTKSAEPSSLKSSSSTGSSSLRRGKSVQSKPAKVLVRATQPLISSSSVSESNTSARIDRPWTCDVCTLENKQGSSHCAACGVAYPIPKLETQVEGQGHEKGKKKTPKARQQLGNGSTTSLFDSGIRGNSGEQSNPATSVGRSVGRGVWKNGGGQRLVSLAQRESIIENAWSDK